MIMKKLVFLFALAACLVGCGPSRYVRENDSVDIGYGTQDRDHLSTSVSNVKVVRGVDPSLDKEAVRVVQSSPKWSPGKQRDRAVKVTYTFPVIFQLR